MSPIEKRMNDKLSAHLRVLFVQVMFGGEYGAARFIRMGPAAEGQEVPWHEVVQ